MKKREPAPAPLLNDMLCIIFLTIIQTQLYSPMNETLYIIFRLLFILVNVLLLCMLFHFGRLKDEKTRKWRGVYIVVGIMHIIFIASTIYFW